MDGKVCAARAGCRAHSSHAAATIRVLEPRVPMPPTPAQALLKAPGSLWGSEHAPWGPLHHLCTWSPGSSPGPTGLASFPKAIPSLEEVTLILGHSAEVD